MSEQREPEVLRAEIVQLVAAPCLLEIRDDDQRPDEPGGLVVGYALVELDLELVDGARWTGREIFPVAADGSLETGGNFDLYWQAHALGDWRPRLNVGLPS